MSLLFRSFRNKNRRIITTGELRHRRSQSRQPVSCLLLVLICIVLFVGFMYLSYISAGILEQTTFGNLTLDTVRLRVIIFIAIIALLVAISILVAGKKYKARYYLQIIVYSLFSGLIFHGMVLNGLLYANKLLANKQAVHRQYRVKSLEGYEYKEGSSKLFPWKTKQKKVKCRRLVAGDETENYYLYLPADTYAVEGDRIYLSFRKGIFGWKVVDNFSIGYGR